METLNLVAIEQYIEMDASDFGYRKGVKVRLRPIRKGERFFRAGEIPEDEQSWNHADQILEEGVSVWGLYRNRWSGSTFCAPTIKKGCTYEVTGMIMQIDTYGDGDFRDLCGSDGEPLLRNVEILRLVTRFPVSMTSTFPVSWYGREAN